MGDLKIITNNHARPLLYFFQLPEKWQEFARKEYDWDKELEDNSQFFIYKNWLHHLSNFERIGISDNHPFKNWDGYMGDSYFSGVLIRYTRDEHGYIENNDGDQLIVVASYYS